MTAKHLGLSNCAYADMDHDQDGFTIRGNWHAPGSPSIVGHYRLADFGKLAVQELGAGRPLIIDDNSVEIAPDEAKTFQDIGIAATICMPLIKSGRLVALMAIHDRAPHHWSDYELTVISEVTGRSWSHVERVRSEAELRTSNARFRAAVRATQDIVWTNDAAGRMIGEQPGWQKLTGQTFDEYQGDGWSSAVHPDDAGPTLEAWNRAVEAREMFVFEHRVRRAGGQWGLFSVRAVPILGDDGEVNEWVGVHTDISAQRATEAALREESQTLEILNRSAAALAAELDLERVVQSVTDAGVELCGAQFGAFFYNVTDKSGGSYMLYTLSGVDREKFSKFPMPRATAVFGPTFAGAGVIRSGDITSDPRYGQNAPHSGMPEGHLPVRSYLAVPVISRSGEVIGGLFFGHPDEDVFSARSEKVMVGLAGQAAIAIDNARLFQIAQTTNETLEERVNQRTVELEQANEALRQAQKMEAIGQLTGGIAHDFNNLLTVIRGSADLLKRPGLSDERQQKYLNAISDTADRAANLTGQLLSFARKQALKPETFDAPERVEKISQMLRSLLGSRINLIVDANCDQCFIHADVTQFETALINLASNAKDAMAGEGEVILRTALHSDDAGREFVSVSVSDCGEGIAKDLQDRIFEPFFTTKAAGKGTGLGLSQVYGFAKQSDGEVKLTSAPGQGTTFTLTLPLAQSPARSAASGSRSDEVDLAGRMVLIVEDNAEVREFARSLLEDMAFDTLIAASAPDALGMLEVDSERVDVIFSDVVMPEMNGIEFGQAVKQRWPAIPVILTSGYSEVIVEHGAHGYPLLQKPYSADQLRSAIAGVLVA